jgi:CheY-like chemotaxis protein
VEHIVDLVAAVIWPLIIVGLIWHFRQEIRTQLFPRLTGVKAFGFEASFAEQALVKASKGKPQVTEASRSTAFARLQREAHLLAGARILWVDDNPRNNFNERQLFERIGARVDPALNTDDALELARMHPYDLIISDWERDEGVNAGPDLVAALRGEGVSTPVVFYVLLVEGRSQGEAVGLTNRPDELVHIVVDALEAEHRAAP